MRHGTRGFAVGTLVEHGNTGQFREQSVKVFNDRGTLIRAGIAGAALMVAAVFVFRECGPGAGPIPRNANFVCVETGRRYAIARNDISSIPVENPDTHRRTLLPCATDDDGRTYVSGRWKHCLADLGEMNKHVDPNSLEVK